MHLVINLYMTYKYIKESPASRMRSLHDVQLGRPRLLRLWLHTWPLGKLQSFYIPYSQPMECSKVIGWACGIDPADLARDRL